MNSISDACLSNPSIARSYTAPNNPHSSYGKSPRTLLASPLPCRVRFILRSGKPFRANRAFGIPTDQSRSCTPCTTMAYPPARLVQSRSKSHCLLPMRFRSLHPCHVHRRRGQGSSDRAFLDMHDRNCAWMRYQHLAHPFVCPARKSLDGAKNDASPKFVVTHTSQISLHKLPGAICLPWGSRGGG
jgi:hypothetical protein